MRNLLRSPSIWIKIFTLYTSFITDNMATESLVSQYPNGSEPANKANDGYKISCSRTQGHNVEFQVDLKKESIVTGIYITLGGMFVNFLSFLFRNKVRRLLSHYLVV